jgi:hypothetical protein
VSPVSLAARVTQTYVVLEFCGFAVHAAQGCGRPSNITDRIPKLEAGEGHA